MVNKSGEFKMTHQATGSHYFHVWRPLYRVFYVSVVARFCFSDGRTDVRTARVKIMTTYSAVAWWVNNAKQSVHLKYLFLFFYFFSY